MLRKQNAVSVLTTEYLELQSRIWEPRQRIPLGEIGKIRYCVYPSIVDTNQEGCVL